MKPMSILSKIQSISLVALVLLLAGCVHLPDGVKPVDNFELPRYLGKWYEIARLDHSFERDLEQVTAEYSLREDGGVKVLNRGYNPKTKEWKAAEGKAYPVGAANHGFLKVSFFGPFYGAYGVFELGADYEYAFVSGPNDGYLWLLARQPQVSPELYQRFVERASALGFKTKELIKVDQVTLKK